MAATCETPLVKTEAATCETPIVKTEPEETLQDGQGFAFGPQDPYMMPFFGGYLSSSQGSNDADDAGDDEFGPATGQPGRGFSVGAAAGSGTGGHRSAGSGHVGKRDERVTRRRKPFLMVRRVASRSGALPLERLGTRP